MRPTQFIGAGALLSQLLPFTAQAASIACNTTYVIQPGDHLSKISEAAYGSQRLYNKIVAANPNVIKQPNVITVGSALYIPCLQSQQAQQRVAPAEQVVVIPATANNATSTAPQAPAPAQAPELPPIRMGSIKVLTGKDYAPYVDKTLPGGGFSYQLIDKSMVFEHEKAEDYRIDVVGDWSAHLQPLLSEGMYDVGFPWFKPDCGKRELLGEASQWRCDNLLFSEPLHNIVITFFSRADEPTIDSAEDAMGKTICRPAGYFTHDMEAMGLVESKIKRFAPDKPEDCFEMLRDGKVDLVTVNADTSARIIQALGMENLVKEEIDLSTVQSLHAVTMKTNPRSRVILRRINRGLRYLYNSEEYRQIAAAYL
ncbi:MAG: transporter substrate-binding domain-containing protein [Gammaproteobacteria bacterium]|nr:transporter substrate-binding domain-containing protein [Gammaproteobacteria bacterium]